MGNHQSAMDSKNGMVKHLHSPNVSPSSGPWSRPEDKPWLFGRQGVVNDGENHGTFFEPLKTLKLGLIDHIQKEINLIDEES